jgi:hypothetical protein
MLGVKSMIFVAILDGPSSRYGDAARTNKIENPFARNRIGTLKNCPRITPNSAAKAKTQTIV